MGKRTIEILNEISDMLGGASDYEIAQHLGVTRGTVSKWRTGTGSMSDETALRAATFADQKTPDALLLEMAAERTTSKKAQDAYRRIAQRLRRSATIITIGMTGILGLFHTPLIHAIVQNCILW